MSLLPLLSAFVEEITKNDVTTPQYKTNPYHLDNKDVGLILLPPDSTVPS